MCKGHILVHEHVVVWIGKKKKKLASDEIVEEGKTETAYKHEETEWIYGMDVLDTICIIRMQKYALTYTMIYENT